jgi:hypothetical protein
VPGGWRLLQWMKFWIIKEGGAVVRILYTFYESDKKDTFSILPIAHGRTNIILHSDCGK